MQRVAYHVAIPTQNPASIDPSLTIAAITDKAIELATLGSKADLAFRNSTGINILGAITTLVAPRVFTGTLLKDGSGNVLAPPTPQKNVAVGVPPPKAESSSNIGVIVGIVSGGTVFCAIAVLSSCWVYRRYIQKQEV
jgi:hypothetical protein